MIEKINPWKKVLNMFAFLFRMVEVLVLSKGKNTFAQKTYIWKEHYGCLIVLNSAWIFIFSIEWTQNRDIVFLSPSYSVGLTFKIKSCPRSSLIPHRCKILCYHVTYFHVRLYNASYLWRSYSVCVCVCVYLFFENWRI